jgi:hypothetical protein
MRFVRYAAFAACMGLSTTAFAQGDDDEEEGWIEETVEEEQPAPAPPPPPKKKGKKKKKKVVIVEEEAVDEQDDQTPPAWTRGRRGKPRKTIPAREGEPPPPGYHVEMKSRKNLWIPGVVLLGSGYLASALTSSALLMSDSASCWDWDTYCRSDGDWGWGFLPLAGPFVIAADADVETGWRVGYAVFGTAQVLGLGLTIGGAASKRPVWVLNRNHRASNEPTTQIVAGPGNLMLQGTF